MKTLNKNKMSNVVNNWWDPNNNWRDPNKIIPNVINNWWDPNKIFPNVSPTTHKYKI